MPPFAQGNTLLATALRVGLCVGIPILWALGTELVIALWCRCCKGDDGNA